MTITDLKHEIEQLGLRYGRLQRESPRVRFDLEGGSTAHGVEEFAVRFCTAAHTYSIHARAPGVREAADHGYLGCIATCRTVRAGERSLRGSDLPDGPFSAETWQQIKDAILAYELVELEPAVAAATVGDVSAPVVPA